MKPKLVADRKCSECLFTPDRIVSGARAKELVTRCDQRGKVFLCHKSQKGQRVICHGSWARYTKNPVLRFIAELKGWVRYVNPDALPPARKRGQKT